MIKGQDLKDVAKSITTTREHKKDYLADTRALEILSPYDTGLDGMQIRFKMEKKEYEFTPTRLCLEQIGDRVGIPRKYADKMVEEAPDLMAKNINHWFEHTPERRMLRTLRNDTDVARAFLSDVYRPLDNADLAERILPRMSDMGLEIKSTALTDTRLYIQAVSPKMQAEIKKVGDVVQSGIVISNSEVGKGSLHIRHLIYTLRCLNGMIGESVVRQHHVGKGSDSELDSEEAQEFFSNETRAANDKAFWLKVGDLMTHTLSKEKFDEIINRLNKTTEVEVDRPVEVIEMLAERFVWQENEKDSVLNHLIKGGDLTQYGILNAVTRAAEDLPNYDRAIEFEKQGGLIMQLKATDFDA